MFGKIFNLSVCAALALAVAPVQAQEAATATGGATGRLQGLSINSGQPIQIEGDKLEVVDAESKAIFTGNVNVTQGPTLMKAGQMTVFYASNSGGSTATGSADIDRIEVENNVYIKSDTQVATGDHGTFDMKSQTLVLSGKEVVLSEGKNTMVGCKLTVNMKTSKAQVDGCKSDKNPNGRVILSITPGSTQQN